MLNVPNIHIYEQKCHFMMHFDYSTGYIDRGGENDLKICVELVFFFLFLAANICGGNMEPAFALIHHDAPEICSLVDGKAAAAAA